jgi:hypothetical protein
VASEREKEVSIVEILKFDSGQSPKGRRGRAGYVSILAAGLFVAAIGSTFAATITINSNTSLEYGQGVSSTVTCSDSVVIIPENQFVNNADPSLRAFRLLSITALDTRTASTSTGLGNCIGKTFKFTAYGNSDNTAVKLFENGATDIFACRANITGYSASKIQGNLTDCGTGAQFVPLATGFKILWDAATPANLADAGSFAVITVESQDTSS